MSNKIEEAREFVKQWTQELIMMSTCDHKEDAVLTIVDALEKAELYDEMADNIEYLIDEFKHLGGEAIENGEELLQKHKEIEENNNAN